MEKLRPNAETFRLRALTTLLNKDIDRAGLEIRKALELEPRWEIIRFTAATIDYYSALSRAVLSDHFDSWPLPIDWAFVKRDDESLTPLRDAARVFLELAETPFKEKDEKRVYESWHLACLINDADRQDDAKKYYQKIVAIDPTHFRAIAWAIERNLDVDLGTSERALRKLIAEGKAEIPHILALVSYYLKFRRTKKALDLLNDRKVAFSTQQQEALWKYWHIRVLTASGKRQSIFNSLDDLRESEKYREAQTLILFANAKQKGDWQPLFRHLESSYEKTKDPIFLFECCALKAQHKDWKYVSERAETLVEKIGTVESLRIAAISTYNAKRFQRCLELLDKHRKLCYQQKLPIELRRIRISCQRALGILLGAIIDAEELAREEPTTVNLLSLAEIYAVKGDTKMVAVTSRPLADRLDVPLEKMFWLSRILQWEDREIAITFWRRAIIQNLPDSLVAEACTLGFQLGLDQEVTPLLTRMQTLGYEKRGGVQFATRDDIISFFKQRHEDAIKLSEFYRSGTIPIHMIAEALQKRPLADLYHSALLENESISKPKGQLYLLARHGGRGLITGFPDKKPDWRLNLDITALLLAAHLDILSEVEKAFKPLRIPQDTVPALRSMRDRFTAHQPSRFRIYEQIIELAERGLLRTAKYELPAKYENTPLIAELGKDWVAAFENVRANNGYVVEFLPLKKQDLSGISTALPPNAHQYLVNCRGLVEALRKHGPLSDELYKTSLELLGTEGKSLPSDVLPRDGSLLFCCGIIPEVLADAKLLQIICERYTVYFEKSELDRVRDELKQYRQRIKMSDWLGSLVERIRKGIDEQIYQIIPYQVEKDEMGKALHQPTPEILCMLTLVQMKSQANDVTWVDDRSLNSFAAIGATRSIGINEILKALVGAGVMDLDAYYRKLLKLRAANVLFIPVQKDEILYHIKKAAIENGIMVETQELSILRRYIASCLMHGDILQKPPISEVNPNKPGEMGFVLSLSHAMVEAIIDVWANEEEFEGIREARSDCLIENLYLDHLALLDVTGMPRSKQNDQFLLAVSYAGLMFQAVILVKPIKDEHAKPQAKDFLEYLYARILRKRIDADPQFLPMLADMMKKYFLNARSGPLKKYPKWAVIGMFQEMHEALPESLRNEIDLDTDFMSSIGYKTATTVSVADLNFEANNFWKSAVEAVNGRSATISPIGSDHKIELRHCKTKDGRNSFCFNHPENGQPIGNNDFDVELLLESPIEREKTIRNNRYWFDCANIVFERVVAEIVSMEDARHRIEASRAWRDSSATVFYAALNDKLRNNFVKQLPFNHADLLPVSVDGLLRYFRLTNDVGPGIAFKEVLEESAKTLLLDENIEIALGRFVSLPIPLPQTLMSAISALSKQDRRTLIKRLMRLTGSPISKTHFLFILLSVGDDASSYRRLAKRLINKQLSAESEADFTAYLSILIWVNEEFGHWQDSRNLSHQLRLVLVWSHSYRLYTIFKSLGAPSDWLGEMFVNARYHVPHEFFSRNPDYWLDIAHPRRVNWRAFLLSSLSYAIGKKNLDYIDGKNIQERLHDLTFPQSEGLRWAHPFLMIDSTRTRNSLESFFGGDRGEKLSSLLSAEDVSSLSSSSLRETAKDAISILNEKKDFNLAWAVLNAIIGDLPPDPSLSNDLKALYLKTDFVELFKTNSLTGRVAILFASFQAGYIKDEGLRGYLKEQLAKIAVFLADNGSGGVPPNPDLKDRASEFEDLGIFLLDPALNISIAAEKPNSVIPEFCDILRRFVDAWPAMVPMVKRSVQRFYQELPISQAQQFIELLIRLRAE